MVFKIMSVLRRVCSFPLFVWHMYIHYSGSITLAYFPLISMAVPLTLYFTGIAKENIAATTDPLIIINAVSLAYLCIPILNIHGLLADLFYCIAEFTFTMSYFGFGYTGLVLNNLTTSLYLLLAFQALYNN